MTENENPLLQVLCFTSECKECNKKYIHLFGKSATRCRDCTEKYRAHRVRVGKWIKSVKTRGHFQSNKGKGLIKMEGLN